ncbi:hypothetical protein MJI20_27990, partial [Salmonella enterica subsp. enterica serovar Anatum]|nr:hypothetical protein [Salmonella enterica subsp. enterica serovar Anatum]
TNLVGLLDGYFHHEAQVEGGQHLNVNVMNREMLLDAIEHPENIPLIDIRFAVIDTLQRHCTRFYLIAVIIAEPGDAGQPAIAFK